MSAPNREAVHKARELQAQREADRLSAHARVAGMLRGPNAPVVLESARRQVGLWRQRQLCSPDYIQEWTSLLSQPVSSLADFIESGAPSARRLRQNTPFADFLRA